MAESTTTQDPTTSNVSKKKSSKKKVSKKKVEAKVESKMSSTETPVTVAAAAPVTASPANVSGGSKTVSWIALLFSAVALCAGGYAWYLTAVDSKISAGQQTNRFDMLEQKFGNFDNSQSDITAQISQLKTLVTQAEDNFSAQIRTIRSEISEQESSVKQQLTTSQQNIESKTSGFRQEFDTLSGSIVKLRSELGRSIDSWTLEEVEQLMFVANQRLQFAGDSQLAAKALQLADDRLQQLADPTLNSVRELLASEISALNNVSPVDMTGVLNRLSVLSSNVDALSLIGEQQFNGSVTTSNDQSTSDSQVTEVEQSGQTEQPENAISRYTQPLVDAGAGFLSSLGDLIQVEKSGKALRPIISAEGRQITYDKAKLILESAQIAFIREQSELYQNRLASAKQWVEQNFDTSVETASKWVAELESLSALTPNTDIPDISASSSALREIIQGSDSKD